MSRTDTTAVLNRILTTLNRSFVMYLSNAMPYFSASDEAVQAEFENLIADQKTYVQKLGELILDRHNRVEMGEFPMVYTDCHDLSMPYLLKELLKTQRRDSDTIAACATQLAGDPAAAALAEEILGNAQGHLESLTALAGRSAAKPPWSAAGA